MYIYVFKSVWNNPFSEDIQGWEDGLPPNHSSPLPPLPHSAHMQKTSYLSEMLNRFVQIAKWICLGRLTTLLPYYTSSPTLSLQGHNIICRKHLICLKCKIYLWKLQNGFVLIVWLTDEEKILNAGGLLCTASTLTSKACSPILL